MAKQNDTCKLSSTTIWMCGTVVGFVVLVWMMYPFRLDGGQQKAVSIADDMMNTACWLAYGGEWQHCRFASDETMWETIDVCCMPGDESNICSWDPRPFPCEEYAGLFAIDVECPKTLSREVGMWVGDYCDKSWGNMARGYVEVR